MKILITGANGQLGTELINILNCGSAEIGLIPDEFTNAQIISLDINDLDITDMHKTIKFISAINPAIIINCAGFTDVNACETNQNLAFEVNAIGPRNLAMSAEKASSKLVHISTDYVFDGNKKEPYCEYDTLNPQNVYGKTKHLGEQYVMEFCHKCFIVRTSWLYGYNGKNFVKTIIKNGNEKDRLDVVNDQTGNPTNANDLAYHILKLVNSDEYGIYHCSGNDKCTWYDFACKIIKYANIDCNVCMCDSEKINSHVKRPTYSCLENMMLKNTAGDEMRPLDIALKHFIKNLKEGIF